MAFQQFPQKGGIPSGNTAGRPSGAVIGDTYYNGQLGLLEIYDGTNWVPSSAPAGIPSVTGTDIGTGRAYASGAVTLAFTAGTNGGAPYGYTGIATIGATTYTTGATTDTSTTLAVGNPGTYALSASAYNGFGSSPTSVPVNLAITTVPDAPTGAATSALSAGSVTLVWTAPATGGKAISGYTYTVYTGTSTSTVTSGTTSTTSVTITTLTGGPYTFKVAATNANGTGLQSAASASFLFPLLVDYLVLAGGGGGGSVGYAGGGAGAGGLRSSVSATGGGGSTESTLSLLPGTAYTVTVGAGGAPGVVDNTSHWGSLGSNSVFNAITSLGGGGGGGRSGGCGGGGNFNTTVEGGPNTGGAGTSGQGYAGGTGNGSASDYGGGGGGTGAIGATGSNAVGGNGGAGASNSITGSAVNYGGGGGAGVYTGGTWGTGGAGGGGRGAQLNPGQNPATSGTANTGGGGGGGSGTTSDKIGGNGGSGIVILKIPSGNSATFTGGVTQTLSTAVSGYKIYTVTAAGPSDTVTFS